MQMACLLGLRRQGELGFWALEPRRVAVRTVQRRATGPTAPGNRTTCRERGDIQSSRTSPLDSRGLRKPACPCPPQRTVSLCPVDHPPEDSVCWFREVTANGATLQPETLGGRS